jgi:hypothetical protein
MDYGYVAKRLGLSRIPQAQAVFWKAYIFRWERFGFLVVG